MLGFRPRIAAALAGLLIFGAAGVNAQTALAPLNMVPSAPDALGQVPGHLVWLKEGLQAVQDPVDGQLVFVNDEGRVVGRASLPPEFRIGAIAAETAQVRLIDVSGRREVIVPRTIDPGKLPPLAASDIKSAGAPRQSGLVRKSPQQLLYTNERQAGSRQLDVKAVGGGNLMNVYEIGAPAGGDRYIVSEEIAAATPSLQVRVFVQKFDRAGNVAGVAYVPLDGMDVVPRDFVTVTDHGNVRILMPTASGVKIREIKFSKAARHSGGTKLDLKSLGTVSREISVQSKVAPVEGANKFNSVGPRFQLKAPAPPTTGKRVLEIARSYFNVNWIMTPENYSKPGVESLCRPEAAKLWMRPIHFTPDTIGKTIGPMPYRWGGDDTPESFKLKAEWGALAGDICTCRDPGLDYCLAPDTAGVDCSGFVSRAWGIEKRGTSGLLDVANDVKSLADLRLGDAFDWPGHHVRLFVGHDPDVSGQFLVVESSTRRDCEGVCERSYRPSELNNFRMIRYRGITN